MPATAGQALYVDGALATDCASGNYSITKRDCSGSGGNAYNTLQEADTASLQGDTILVRGGTYTSSNRPILSIIKPSTIWRNYGTERPIIDGNFQGQSYGMYHRLVKISGYNVTFDGFEVRNSLAEGIRVIGAPGFRILNCNVHNTYETGILIGEKSDYGVIDNCDISYGCMARLDNIYNQPTFGSNLAVADSDYVTVRNSRIFNGHNEGLDVIKGSEYCIIENNEIFGNNRVYLYFSNARYNTARWNLIYGAEPGFSAGIWLGGEDAFTSQYSPEWNTGNKIYGNMVANCVQNMRIAGEPSAYETNDYIYHNTFVENQITDGSPGNANVGYVWQTQGGHKFRNNIIWQTNGLIASVKSGVVAGDYNLWSKEPPAAIKGAQDLAYNLPGLVKTSGWNSLSGGGLSKTDFHTAQTSPGNDKAAFLCRVNQASGSGNSVQVDDAHWFSPGEPVTIGTDRVVITSVDYSGSKITLGSYITWNDNDPIYYDHFSGTAPDIGAYEYTGATAAKKGDLNADNKVDIRDLGIFLSNWGKTTKPPADLNQDGIVDVRDLGILLGNWG